MAIFYSLNFQGIVIRHKTYRCIHTYIHRHVCMYRCAYVIPVNSIYDISRITLHTTWGVNIYRNSPYVLFARTDFWLCRYHLHLYVSIETAPHYDVNTGRFLPSLRTPRVFWRPHGAVDDDIPHPADLRQHPYPQWRMYLLPPHPLFWVKCKGARESICIVGQQRGLWTPLIYMHGITYMFMDMLGMSMYTYMLYMCVCTCWCTYMYVYLRVHTYAHIHLFMYMYIY